VMEGVTFAMGDVVNLMRDRGIRIQQVRLSGGGARSAFWRQMQADIYGSGCATINSEEGPAYGASLLAAVGAGEYRDIQQACAAAVSVVRTSKPNAKTKRLYQKLHEQYDRLYPALSGEFQRMSKL